MALLKRLRLRLLWAGLLTAAWVSAAWGAPAGELLSLCYHSIQPAGVPGDPYVLTQQRFAEQMEYLRTHGYHPVSLEQVSAAMAGTTPLPNRAVLLSFDDGYRSYHDFVLPLLELYGYPSMVAVVGSWMEQGPPDGLSEPLMTWEQLRAAAANPKVSVVSHSFDLHRAVAFTPQGDSASIVEVRAFDPARGAYETAEAYRSKLRRDFEQQKALFRKHLGSAPRAIVWPYGFYNAASMQVAAESGLRLGFALDEKENGTDRLTQPMSISREMVLNQPIDLFIYSLKHLGVRPALRALQVDLDLIYDPQSAEQTESNLGRLIERLDALKVNTVFLQAFSDPDGSGNISSVYFQNRVLPMRADIFAHAVHRVKSRGLRVFAWMPALSFLFGDEGFNQRFQVRELKNGTAKPTTSWYRRLTPFSREVAQKVGLLFEDLASHSRIDGILFQDDAYLAELEDFHPLALEAFSARTGRSIKAEMITGDALLAGEWMNFKTEGLIKYLDQLSAVVRETRPDALFARNLYAPVVMQPESEEWFAQNYQSALAHYDYVVVMAYPQMEGARHAVRWLRDLARAAAKPLSDQKTVFKLQTYDWRKRQWVPDQLLLEEMRAVLAAGVRHLAYYPDDLWEEKPDLNHVLQEMSTRGRPPEY